MARHDDDDPFAGLEDWAAKAERRVRSERRRDRFGRVLAVVVGGLVLAAVAVPLLRNHDLFGTPGAVAAYPTSSAPPGVTVLTSASAAPTDPFAGTPAATYPKGAAGITLPPPKAAPGFTAAEVKSALAQVRGALIAGRLTPSMLIGHDPKPFLALLAPNARDDVRKWFADKGFTSVATWIDPRVTLDPAEQPRVSGRVTYTSTMVDGIPTLRVTTNFVWIYAFTGADHPLAVEHDETLWELPSAPNLRAGDRGLWIRTTKSYAAWVDCAAAAQGLLAPTRTGAANPVPLSTEDQDAYLKADHSLEITDDCGRRPS
jgi:hypothetical protein